MDDQTQLLETDPQWHELLAFYEENQPAPVLHDPESEQAEEPNKWVTRVIEIEGLDAEALSKLHGQMIALGYLEFDLMSRSDGIGYLISSDGKKALRKKRKADSEVA